MFFYVIIIAYNLFIAGLLCVFNFSSKCDKHWFQVLNQIVANDSSDMISKIRFSLRYIKVSTISINVALIGFSLPITWIAYNRTDFVIYGVPSIALFFNALSCAAETGLLFILTLIIVILYCYQRLRYLSFRVKNISKEQAMNRLIFLMLIKRLNAEHNSISNQIHRYNQFWKQTFIVVFVTIMPLNLFLFHQLTFGRIDNLFLYYLMLIGTIQTVGLSFFVIMVSSLMYRESKRVAKHLINISVKFWIKYPNNLKVSEPLIT